MSKIHACNKAKEHGAVFSKFYLGGYVLTYKSGQAHHMGVTLTAFHCMFCGVNLEAVCS